MIFERNNNKIKVFLAETTEDNAAFRAQLHNVLKKAEIEVYTPSLTKDSNIKDPKKEIRELIKQSHCSIHILGKKYGNLINGQSQVSIPEFQFIEAKNFSHESDSEFKLFIWQPDYSPHYQLEPQQEKFVTSIKNSVLHNVILSYHESPVILVEDINIVMNVNPLANIKVQKTEVFFIYNELDEEPANAILDLLDDVLKVERLKMVQSSSQDYSPFLIEQVKVSKLVVVYFKWSGDWSIPFVQQLWKLIGGASSGTEIFLIGDSSYQPNAGKRFDAPLVTSLTLSEDLIPLEIKVQSDKIANNK